ncbi:MAG: polysaccharide pyruvyl transferase family protein [Kurthia sp.]|nr:polysaccharide pyruvyl transferase family protein [Candidatus Kurthia equi]
MSKKYLIRAGVSPFDHFDAGEMITKNSIGSNVGNLVYAYSIFRTLMTDEVEIEPDYYQINVADANRINENYDAYIIPLADAFRENFIPKLRAYTQLINKLKIPVYVIGVGLSRPFEPNLDEKNDFDKDVIAFVKAVLKRSSIIGVRGQITADYLTKLGFKEEIDHTVIGCPSMYMNGPKLDVRSTNLTSEAVVAINSSPKSPKNVRDFIEKSRHEFDEHYFIPQWLKELRMTWLGENPLKKIELYPSKTSHQLYQEDRVRYFLDVPSWLNFLGKMDFSFGTRLHGNVAAILAGTPSLIIPKDARMRELADYHQMPSLFASEINANTSILEVMQTKDFSTLQQVDERNFNHFISFLEKNNISHIYGANTTNREVALDIRIKGLPIRGPIESFQIASEKEKITRWKNFQADTVLQFNKQIKELQTKNKKLKTELDVLKKKNDFQRRTLNRKAVRASLKFADFFSMSKK